MKRISILLLSLAFVGGCITVRLIFLKTNSTLQPPISPKAPASGGKSSEAIDVPSSTLGGLAKLKTGGDVVPGAFIEIRRSAGRTYGAVVDKDGRYAFGYVEPGTYQVFGKLHSNGRSFPLAILQIKAGESLSQDLFFPLGPSISGKIVPWDQKMLKAAEMIIKSVRAD